MDWWQFGLLLNDNALLYVEILLASSILYYIIYRKVFLSVLDPIMFTILFSLFGFSVVIFLFLTNNIQSKFLVSYLLTQCAFIGGFFSFKSITKENITSSTQVITFEGEKQFIKIIFIVCSTLYIILQVLSFRIIGVPLLIGSHVDIYSGSGGWGILGHLLDVLKPLSIFLLIYYLFNKSTTFFFYIYKYLFLIVLLVFFALSGSRSEFMMIGLILFCFVFLNGCTLKNIFNAIRKYELLILSIALGFVFFTIYFQSKGQDDGSNNLDVFLFRLVSSGDVYYFAYPNNNIEKLNNSQPFLALFGSIFSTLRLIPHENQPVVLGFQLFKLYGESDAIAGPNARHNVFGYVYFGFYGSIVFSYFLGLMLSITRNKFFVFFRKNILGQILYVIIYLNMSVIETDPPMVISNLENVLLILPIILFLCCCIFILIANYDKKLRYE